MTDLELKKSMLTCPGDTIQEHIDIKQLQRNRIVTYGNARLNRLKAEVETLTF